METAEQLQQELQAARQRINQLEAQLARNKQISTEVDEVVQRYHNLFEYAGDSILIIDPRSLRISQANSNAARRLGYSSEELLQLTLPELEYQTEGDKRNSGWESSVSRTHMYESLYRHKDGSLIPVEVSSRIIKVGNQILLQNFVRDIRKRKEIEFEREHLIAELDAFAGTVAHDLKSPASTIITATQGLLNNYQMYAPAKVVQYLQIIDRSANKVNQIIDGLLMLSSVRKQKDLPIDRLNMAAIVNDSRDALSMMVNEYHAVITVASEMPAVMGYAPWVEEVWTNYLSNAMKYGGKPPLIRIGSEVTGDGFARFWVADNGQGIPTEMLPRLFNEFTRLDRSPVSGTGLGLSIVQRIVHRLGGKVGVQSILGKGSLFSFTLRLAK